MYVEQLVFDRTQEDVDRVFTLKHRILTEGLSSLSEEERTEYLSGTMKGAYNAADMTRVSRATIELADNFMEFGYELQDYMSANGVAPDTVFQLPYDPDTMDYPSGRYIWSQNLIPTKSQADIYLNNVKLVRDLIPLPKTAPAVPPSLDYLTYTTANQIEYLLYVIDKAYKELKDDMYGKVDHAIQSFLYAGEVVCGE